MSATFTSLYDLKFIYWTIDREIVSWTIIWWNIINWQNASFNQHHDVEILYLKIVHWLVDWIMNIQIR